MDRLLLTTDEMQFVPPLMVPALLKALQQRRDMQLIGICVPRKPADSALFWQWGKLRLGRSFQRIFDRSRKPAQGWSWPEPRWLRKLTRHHGIPLLTPGAGGLCDPGFVSMLEERLRPTLLMNCYCVERFSDNLLGMADMAVNYHNGSLPGYRGLKATHWSLYHGECQSGFAFHRMTAEIDAGPVLCEGAVPVTPGFRAVDLEHAKAAAAARHYPQLLESMSRREEGRPQSGEARYFSRGDWEAIRTVAAPEELTRAELLRRLRAFTLLKIRIRSEWYKVTALKDAARADEELAFQTADGAWLYPCRLDFLPPKLYSLLRPVLASRR